MSESDTLRNRLRFIMKRKPASSRQIHERINNGNRVDQKLWNRGRTDITAAMRAAQQKQKCTLTSKLLFANVSSQHQ